MKRVPYSEHSLRNNSFISSAMNGVQIVLLAMRAKRRQNSSKKLLPLSEAAA
jgi:hypothetical protein